MAKVVPARLFLVPAHAAPRCVVIRRKPSKLWHVMLWHTDTDEIEHGSWFRGTLYPHRMDLSWDGEYLVYLAAGSDNANSWNGVCRPPWLKTLVEWENCGSWTGSGVFSEPNRLLRNYLVAPLGIPTYAKVDNAGLPFWIGRLPAGDGHGEEGILYKKLRRDGWNAVGNSGRTHRASTESSLGWWNQPSQDYPVLRMWLSGSTLNRRTEFRLDSHSTLLANTEWACWDSQGQLLVAEEGWIKRYTLDDLRTAAPKPSFALDLNDLEPPPRKALKTAHE